MSGRAFPGPAPVPIGRHAGRRNRGELTADAPAAVGGRDEIRRFSPSKAQVRYKTEVITALRRGRPVTDTAICRDLGMSRQTVWEWRQDADFRIWLKIDLEQDHTKALGYAVGRHLELAIRGSTESFRILAKLKELGVF